MCPAATLHDCGCSGSPDTCQCTILSCRCIEGTKRCYGLWRVVKDAKDPAKLALFKQGWCLKCLGLCPCS